MTQWPAHIRESYQERAAIMEYDGNIPRVLAERLAFEDTKTFYAEELESEAGEEL